MYAVSVRSTLDGFDRNVICERQKLPMCSRRRLRELEVEGPVHLVDQILERIDPATLETLDLRIRALSKDAINLDHLTRSPFPNLRSLSISRSNHYDSGSGRPENFPRQPWTIGSDTLLSICRNSPSLVSFTIKTNRSQLIITCRDDYFLSELGYLLPNLEYLEIRNDPYATLWTSTGFIALNQRCRRLVHFNLGGKFDINEPAFQNALRESGTDTNVEGHHINTDTDTFPMARINPAADTADSVTPTPFPLCPHLKTLVLTPRNANPTLSREYLEEIYPRAPPIVVAQLQHLLDTHFPHLISLIRTLMSPRGGTKLAKLQRKRTTGNWPTNRLSHFASPWYERLGIGGMKWKLDANEGGLHEEWGSVSPHESDSNSEIDPEWLAYWNRYEGTDDMSDEDESGQEKGEAGEGNSDAAIDGNDGNDGSDG